MSSFYNPTDFSGFNGMSGMPMLRQPQLLQNFDLGQGPIDPTSKVGMYGWSPLSDGASAVASPASQGWWSDFTQGMKDKGILTTTDKNGVTTQGVGNLALSAGAGLLNAYTGMQQYGLFKDQLNFQKESFYKNYEANKATVNTQLEDRQRARVASNAGAYDSVSNYMNKNGVK